MTPHPFAFLVPLVILVPLATGDSIEGSVREGETDTFSSPGGWGGGEPCDEVLTLYVATLTYTPPTDTLALGAGGQSVTGVAGRAAIAFFGGVCSGWAIHVTGTHVHDEASYTLTF